MNRCLLNSVMEFCCRRGSPPDMEISAAGLQNHLVWLGLSKQTTSTECWRVQLHGCDAEEPKRWFSEMFLHANASIWKYRKCCPLQPDLEAAVAAWPFSGILWGNYFGDYPCITDCVHTTSTMACVQSLFKLLGFAFAEDKLLPFVEVALSRATRGRVVVDNKPQWKLEIAEAITGIINEGGIIPVNLPSFLGRMQFADMQLSGRLGKLAMADVREMGTESKVFVPLTSEIKDALALLMVRVESGRPKILEVGPTQKPFVLFLDGAFEPSRQVGADGLGVATIGGVLFSPDGQARVFGCNVDASLLEQ